MDYIKYFKDNYMRFMSLCGNEEKKNYQSDILVDCSNGVGSKNLDELKVLSGFSDKLQISFINNDPTPEFLNDGCGAEFVHKEQTFPKNWNHPGKKCIVFDGDADR